MTVSKTFLLILTFGIMFQATQAKIIVVNPDENLNAILNNTKGGDTVLVKPGTYTNVSLSNKKFSEKEPLVIRAYGSETVFVSGNTISKGISLEINNCGYIVIE